MIGSCQLSEKLSPHVFSIDIYNHSAEKLQLLMKIESSTENIKSTASC